MLVINSIKIKLNMGGKKTPEGRMACQAAVYDPSFYLTSLLGKHRPRRYSLSCSRERESGSKG